MVKLAPPGAGIPFYQKIVLRLYVKPFVASKSNWSENEKAFHSLYQKIYQMAESTPPELRQRKILVNPIRGLEDSSRYWCMDETLEHLVIVGTGIQGLVQLLSHRKTPGVKVDTAAVKPKGALSSEQALGEFALFQKNCVNLINSTKGTDLRVTKWDHPWFGAMNAHEWFWLLGMHALIHLQQLKQIKKALEV